MRGGTSPDDLVRAARAVGIRQERVLEAMRTTPRSGFVPAKDRGMAYRDVPIPIGLGQVTTQPSLSARMLEGLALGGDEHVLEVGTGFGYQTALIAKLAADVVSIERWPSIVEQAKRNLAGQQIHNVRLLTGDGTNGVPELAPYDAIIVSAACSEVPGPLAGQLRIGCRLVAPIGPGGHEDVVLFERDADGLKPREVLTFASFVRLYGRYAP